MKNNYKLALCAFVGMILTQANAAETTLKLTKPSGDPNSPQLVQTVNLGSVADNLFADIRNFELESEADIRRGINNMREVKYIYAVDVDAKNVRATFSGTNDYKVKLTVSNLGLYAKVKFDGVNVLCPSVKVSVRLKNLAPTVTYNYYTGALENFDIKYNRDVDISCSGGLLSFPGVSHFVNSFASEVGGGIVDQIIQGNMQRFAALEQPGTLFGMQEVLADNRVSGKVAAAERYLNVDIDSIIGNLVTGMNLTVGLGRDANGYGKHLAHVGIYQTAPTISGGRMGNFDVSAVGANRISKYALGSKWYSSNWTPGVIYANQFIGAIAYNRVYGMPSYMTQQQVTLGTCGKACE